LRDLIGRTLGRYRIVDTIGAGGMGVVYRAHDERLDRDVAIKVLPETVAGDAARLARFEREARLLASLDHPNIATLHGLELEDRWRFLVMELVAGESLADVLARGAVSVDEALPIALQIARALEAAHARGIVHRDLKPANVMVDSEGRVKVLDFGLAKVRAGDTADRGSSSAAFSQSTSPSVTQTETGVILGTAAYMSPEQARSKPVDKRADVWSFGVLLWEMLTGRPLFSGETVSDVIAAVLNTEPDLDALPTHTPAAVRRLVSRCLRGDPRSRLPDIGTARLELQDVLAGTFAEPQVGDVDDSAKAERRGRTRERWAWAAVALLLAGLAAVLVLQRLTAPPETRPAAHFVLDTPDDLTFGDLDFPTVSPDGRSIAFAGRSADGRAGLWVRALEAPAIRAVPGTEGAEQPFWSPNSTSIAFWAEGELRKLVLATGTVQRICALPGRLLGGTWNNEGTIVFSLFMRNACLYSVPAAGGEAMPLICPDISGSPGVRALFWPQFLPDGRHLLFVGISPEAEEAEGFGLFLTSLEAQREERLVLVGLTRYLYAVSGHLLFTRDGLLLAQPFDAERLVTTGDALPIASTDDAVDRLDGISVWGSFSVSATGLVTWLSGRGSEVRLEWLDRNGGRLGILGEPGLYGQIVLSPDGRRVAVEVGNGGGRFDIWAIDVARGVASRVTSDPGAERDPVWSPDGQELVFTTASGGGSLVRKPLAAGASASLLLDGPGPHVPECWSRDGRTLLCVTNREEEHTLSALSPDGGGPGEVLMKNRFDIDEPQISPDGRWLAFISDESGRFEVYLEPFRRRGERVRVSSDGGGQPKWRGDGKELFYLASDGALMAVDVREGAAGPEVGISVTLIPAADLRAVVLGPDYDDYAVTADGQRFLVKRSTTTEEAQRIHVLLNWPSLLQPPPNARRSDF
jgi:Tol biopolymer transport system component/tRNA A-37 threonylcarbamoyl transferase component Bud32